MIPSVPIGPRTLLNDCNHSATAIFWRSAIVDWNSISTHRFSGQEMGGEDLVPHSLHDLGSGSSPPHLVQLSHWLALLWPPFEMLVTWHLAFLKRPRQTMHFASRESLRAITVCNGIATVASSTRLQVTEPPPRDATFSGLQRGALKRSAGGVRQRKSALSMRCVLSGVLRRPE